MLPHLWSVLTTILLLFVTSCTGISHDFTCSMYTEPTYPQANAKDSLLCVNQIAEEGQYMKAYELAVPWAESGDPDFQYTVGSLLQNDSVLPELSRTERHSRSLAWITKSALQGNMNALRMMSRIYRRGLLGVEKNNETADCWERVMNGLDSPEVCI